MANKPIGTIGNIPTLTVGNPNGSSTLLTDLTTLISLFGTVNSSGAQHWSTLRKQNQTSTTGYQVTAGKTLNIKAMDVASQTTTSTSFSTNLLYGDTDVGFNSASAPTNPAYLSGVNGAGPFPFSVTTSTAVPRSGFFVDFNVPATKYPAITEDTSAGLFYFVWGYET